MFRSKRLNSVLSVIFAVALVTSLVPLPSSASPVVSDAVAGSPAGDVRAVGSQDIQDVGAASPDAQAQVTPAAADAQEEPQADTQEGGAAEDSASDSFVAPVEVADTPETIDANDQSTTAQEALPDQAQQETAPVSDASEAQAAAETQDADANEPQPDEVDGASIHEENDLYEVMLFGQAADDQASAAEAIVEASEEAADVETLDFAQARTMAAALLAAADDEYEDYPPYPRRADGSDVEAISIRWISKDTEGYDNGDDSRLYLVPTEDSEFSVRFQVDYALSGEHNYAPGDIQIRIPAQVFHKRTSNTSSDNDKLTGSMVIPLAQSPSITTDFNWMLVDGEYVLSNTKNIVAATKGFIQFEIKDLIPHEIVDESIADALQATIEVTTHLGNTIGLRSSKIDAQVNTTQQVVRANKDVVTGSPTVVGASTVGEVPASIRAKYPDDTEFLLVTWYAFAYHTGNQPYTLTATDTRTDVATGATTTTLHDGWIIDGQTESTRDLGVVQQGWYKSDKTSSTSVRVAYPISQFDPDTNYTFTNHVDYDLTPIDGVDDPTHASADAKVVWSYSLPQWRDPVGHFNVFKWGNDNDYGNRSDGELTTHYLNYAGTVAARDDIPTPSDFNSIPQHLQGHYGLYKKALNEMRDGEDYDIAYTIKSEGYLLPWTYEGDTRKEESYGKRPVTMVTEDTGIWNGTQTSHNIDFTPGVGMDFVSLSFVKPIIGKIKSINVNPDGSFTAKYAGDGTFDYQRDYDDSKIPPIVLEIQRNGAWETYATADYSSGSCVITLVDGTVVSGEQVDFPEGTENFRTSVTSGNAYVYYYVRPTVRLHDTAAWRAYIEELFENNPAPTADVWNGVNMKAYTAEGGKIVDISKNGFDRLMGYTADIAVIPFKDGTVGTIDYGQKTATLRYEARVEERSVISDLETYQDASDEGIIASETSGTWYDLLPVGVNPVMETIRLRNGDTIRDAYTIPDYKGTGRTMLVVEASLTPTPQTYEEDGILFYEDVPSITFQATVDINYIIDYGNITEPDDLFSDDLHNVIVFESGNDTLGSVEGYQAEKNDPDGTGNVRTPEAWSRDAQEAAEEKAALAGLDEGRDTESFLYAGVTTHLEILNAASTSLLKEVSVNNDGWWSQGTYYGNREANARDVYEGGMYSYRIFMMSNANTQTRNMVLYDSLENYVPIQGNDDEDVQAIEAGKRWRGTLRNVDVSLLRKAGIDAVVYYSTMPEMKIQEVDDPLGGHINPDTTDISDASVWVKASEYTGDLADVHAIAVDCRRALDGSEFVLEPESTVTAFINMWSPQGEEASEYIEGDYHAYNNIFLNCISVDQRVGGEGAENLIRQDYVKVGLVENTLTVNKEWDDDDDRDGIRADEITFTLYRDGKVYTPIASGNPNAPEVVNPVTVQADENGDFPSYTFRYLPYCDDEGNVFTYSVRESLPDGYSNRTVRTADGKAITIKNIHEPETTEVSGAKIWVGDTEEVRPAVIQVNLYADGELVDAQRVRADADGFWNFSFTGIPKYRDHGTEIVYTVDELRVNGGSLDSYIETVEDTNIINTYHPMGDVELTKRIVDATNVTADDTFEFEFAIANQEGTPVFDEYAYDIVGEDGAVVSNGKVATGTIVELADAQTIQIHEVQQGYTVTATESVPEGYTARGGETRELVVKPNQTVSAEAVNVYKTEGLLNLRATKTLTGRDMRNYQFRFNLTTDEAGENVVTAASSRIDGSVTFDALRLSNEDAGTTRTYYIHELDFGRPGYTYDDAVYKVDVEVVDNGDGTMTATPTYYERGLLGLGWSKLNDVPAFANEYHAEGDLEIKAWKTLKKRDLKADEFTFELVDSEGAVVATAANDENGVITFPKIHFTEKDVDKTVAYTIRERAGGDNTVIYSTSAYTITATIYDNGDGTLSFDQTSTDTSGAAATPVFTNDVKDGKLAVEKVVEDGTVGEFKFKVKLTGPDVPEDGTYEFTKEEIGDRLALIDALPVDKLAAIGNKAASLFMPDVAYAAPGDVASGTYEGVDWRITASNELIIGSEGQTQTFSNTRSRQWNDYPWKDHRTEITSVKFVGTVVGRGSMYQMFQNFSSATSFDVSSFDTSQVTSFGGMFQGCEAVETLDLSSFSTSNISGNSALQSVFSTCSSLTTLDISGFDSSNAANTSYIFQGASNIRSITLGPKWTVWSGYGTSYLLPNPPSASPYTGKWVRIDGDVGSKTASELAADYPLNSTAWAGTWVWGEPMAAIDIFADDQAIEQIGESQVLNTAAVKTYVIPEYNGDNADQFAGWVPTMYDAVNDVFHGGSSSSGGIVVGTSNGSRTVQPGGSLFDAYVIEAGEGVTNDTLATRIINLTKMYSREHHLALYPLFAATYNISYAAEENGSNIYDTDSKVKKSDLASYALKEYTYNDREIEGWKLAAPTTSPFSTFNGTYAAGTKLSDITNASGKTLAEAIEEGSVTDFTFSLVFLTTYQVDFKPGEGASGSMASLVDQPMDEDVTIPAPTFYYFNHHVVGWVDEDGNEFSATTIPANTVTKSKIALTAVWEPDDNSVNMRDGEFEFTLKSNERATFDNIPAGTAYEVYEETSAGWVLVKSVDSTGEIKPLETSTATFTNEYSPDKTSIQLGAMKLLDGQPAKASDGFTFTLHAEDQSVLQTVSNTDGGGVVFAPITLRGIGTYRYIIRETQGTDPNITYDGKFERVFVTVKDDGVGNLYVERIEYADSGERPTFANTTKTGSLSLEKRVTGPGAPADAQFTFVVTLSAAGEFAYTGSKTGTVRSGGTITLAAGQKVTINGLPAGTTYSVEEVNVPSEFELARQTGSSGTIAANRTAAATFTNAYDTDLGSASINLEVRKTLEGAALEAGQFDFMLVDASGNVVDVASNDVSGKVSFDLLEFDEAGTYAYTVRELAGADDTIAYDTSEKTVTVTVSAGDDGTLVATPSYDPDDEASIPTFENAKKTGTIMLAKALLGPTPASENTKFTFTLTLTDDEGAELDGTYSYVVYDYEAESPKSTGTVASGGTVQISTFEYAVIGDLPVGSIYTLEEADAAGFTQRTEGPVTGEVSGLEIAGQPIPELVMFVNEYAAYGELQLQVRKVLEGRDLAAGQFSFELRDESGEVVSRATNDADGLVSFAKLPFTEADSGETFVYTVVEVDDGAPGYTYDDAVLTYTVTPTDKGDGTMGYDVRFDGEQSQFENAYEATGSIDLAATKALTGRALAANQFAFELVNEAGKVVATAKNAADGSIAFNDVALGLDDVGTHTYTIREVVPEDPAAGYTYDSHEEAVAVTVVDDGTSFLKATAAYDEDGAAFANEYKAEGRVVLEASKALSGRTLAAGQFGFEVKDAAGNTVATGANDAAGKVAFSAIQYTQADLVDDAGAPVQSKEFAYTITEVNDAKPGYTYDAHAESVTVTVKDNGDGTLSATAAYDADGAAFANEYKAKGEVVLKASKQLTGRALANEQFSFEVRDDTGALVTTAKNAEDGTVAFPAIPYTQASMVDEQGRPVASKTFTYRIAEAVPSPVPAGYAYDGHYEDVTVTVVDNGDGTLSATAAYDADGAAFANEYKAEGRVVLEASKALSGRTLAAGQFGFEVKDTAGKVVATGKNDAVGKVAFSAIQYTQADLVDGAGKPVESKEFAYTIVEVNDAKPGYTYDAHAESVTVTVKDNGDGTLSAMAAYDADGAAFANEYKAEGSVRLAATKQLAGRALAAGQFSFQLLDEQGTVLQTKANNAAGAVAFDALRYNQDQLGTYTYTIREAVPEGEDAAPGYTYDTHAETVTVNVTDNGNGTLRVTAAYDEDGAAFANTYKAAGQVVIEVGKAMTNARLTEGDYTFELLDASGQVLQTATNAGDGTQFAENVTFAPIPYTEADAGKTFTYTVREVAGDAEDTIYDEHSCTLTVRVADNGDGTLEATPSYNPGSEIFANRQVLRGSAIIAASKALSGRALAEGQFGFQLLDANGEVLQEATNAADGSVTFAPLAYNSEQDLGTHTYTVVEVAKDEAGYTYDAHAETVTVEVSVDTEPAKPVLVCEVAYDEDGAAFANTYKADGQVALAATKALSGRALAEGQFGFQLLDANGEVLQEAANAADGTVAFEPLAYTQDDAGKTFAYTIREAVPEGEDAEAGYTYDAHAEGVTVTVADNGDGTLDVTAAYDADGAAFANQYQARGQVALEASKTLQGRTLKDGMFTFEVRDADGKVLATATNDAEGKVAFQPLSYTQADMVDAEGNPVATKEFAYTIAEVNAGQTGYTYDEHAEDVTVAVVDNGDGTLGATAAYDQDGAAFENSFFFEAKATLAATKAMFDGSAPADGGFAFTLVPSEDNPENDPVKGTQTVTNTGADVVFGEFVYPVGDEDAVYAYTIQEQGAAPGNTGSYILDITPYRAEVKVGADCSIQVTYSTADGAKPVFVNMVDDHPSAMNVTAPLRLAATKTLDGRQPGNATFTFAIDKVSADAPGQFPATAKSDADGNIVFAEDVFAYTSADIGKTYRYRVTEVDDGQAGYAYDTAAFDVFVRVYARNGVPTVYVYFQKDGADVEAITFANTTKPETTDKDNPRPTTSGSGKTTTTQTSGGTTRSATAKTADAFDAARLVVAVCSAGALALLACNRRRLEDEA